MKPKKLLGLNIIHVPKDDAYYQSLKQYEFYKNSYAYEFSVSFTRVENSDAIEIIESLQLVKRTEATRVVYECAERIKYDKIQKINRLKTVKMES